MPIRGEPGASNRSAIAGATRGEQPAGRLRVEAHRIERRWARRVQVAGDVVAVAGVAARAHAPRGRLQRARVQRQPVGVDHQPHAAALGDLPPVAGEAVPGDVGDGVHVAPERDEHLRGGSVELPHAGDGHYLVVVTRAGEHQACPEWLRQEHRVAGSGARLAQHALRMDEALHGQPEHRLGIADGVPARHGAARLGDDGRRGLEDGGHRRSAGSARGTQRR